MADSVLENYARLPLSFERGEGSWLIASDGRRYLDCASGIAVNALGHSHPRLIEALTEQAQKLWHVSNLYRIPEQEKVAEMLAKFSGLDRVFFCNSGAEATEGAVKVARRAMHHRGEPNRYIIIAAEGAFHGRTLGMLAATDRPDYRVGFGPMPEGFEHFPFGNLNVLRDRLASDSQGGEAQIAAVMVESVQGDGGARALPEGFLNQLRTLCDEFGCFLIADEVQVGMGRSGHLFSYEPSGILPDIVAMAKGLGGGFPIGAVLMKEEIASGMSAGSHGSTFGGNPLAMAVAKAVLEVLTEKGFLENARKKMAKLEKSLKELSAASPKIFEVSGKGFLLGLGLAEPHKAETLMTLLREEGVLSVIAANNTLRLLPPLTISEDEIDLLVEALKKAVSALKGV